MNIKDVLKDHTALASLQEMQLIKFDSENRNSSMMNSFYKSYIVPKMVSAYDKKNVMQVPKLLKLVINVGFGPDRKNDISYVFEKIKAISGQLPKLTKARKSVSNFKLREGDVIGCMVTLRGVRMYNFLEKLLFIHLARVQNFTGLSQKSFDGHGNFSFGIQRHSVFIESKDYRPDFDFGMDITIQTSAKTNDEAYVLLNLLGFPFKSSV
jgi:large subunit ribosomal protein L5